MLTLVPTPIGNIEDITYRALFTLQKASILLCEDTRVTKKLLHLLAQKFSIDFGQKEFIAFHEHNQKAFLASITPTFFDQEVVFVSDAGMPAISDPGAMLVRYAQEHNIAYDVLPGPSAAVTAYAASGFEGKWTFFGFLPHKGEARAKAIGEVLEHPFYAIVYEAPHRLLKLLDEIAAIDHNRELFLAKELTKLHQKFFKGGAGELLKKLENESIKGEWVIVVAPGKKEKKLLLGQKEIMTLPLSNKEKAKLLSKITSKSTKEWYNELTKLK